MCVFPGLRSPLPDAVKNTVGDNVRAVAIDGDGGIFHEDTRLARVAHRDLGRGRLDLREGGVETFEDGGTQGAQGCAEDKAAGLARVARFVRARAETDSDAIDATLATQVLPKPGACAGNFTFAGREDDGDVKLHAATVAESITNWPEVVDKLRGTRFEKYLTMDGSVLP